jgi:Spy/CpxP family protein refolding chaperone
MTMNRIQLFTMGAMLSLVLSAVGQPLVKVAETSKEGMGQDEAGKQVPTAADQLKFLAPKLELTDDQQAKMRPILQALHDQTQKLVDDESITGDERLSRVRSLRMMADKHIRSILSEDQKAKLDEVEHGPHPELHGDVVGAKSPGTNPQ